MHAGARRIAPAQAGAAVSELWQARAAQVEVRLFALNSSNARALAVALEFSSFNRARSWPITLDAFATRAASLSGF